MPGWTGLPLGPSDTVDIQNWDWFAQFTLALRDRDWSLGREFFPRVTGNSWPVADASYCAGAPGYSGFITSTPTSVSGGTRYRFTDNTADWDTAPLPPSNRWYDYEPPSGPDPSVPRFYDLIVEVNELHPSGVVRSRILASGHDWVEVEATPIDDAIVAKQVANLAAFSGKRYLLVRQHTSSHPSLHWHDRIVDWPNCRELAKGFVINATNVSVTEASTTQEETLEPENVEAGDYFMLRIACAGRNFEARVTSTDATASEIVDLWIAEWSTSAGPMANLLSLDDEGDILRITGVRPGVSFATSTYTINVAGGSNTQSVTKTVIVQPYEAQRFRPGRFSPSAPGGPFELMVKGGGKLRRIPITGNTEFEIQFAAQSFVPDTWSRYAVIPQNGIWRYMVPRYQDFHPKAYNQPSHPDLLLWYGGHQEPSPQEESDPRFYTHYWDGILRVIPCAAASITLLQDNGSGLCLPQSMPIFDIDFWTEVDDQCTAAERPHAENFYKSFRGLQVHSQDICGFFIERKNHSNLGAVPALVSSTWWKSANINHFTTTVTGGDGTGFNLAGSMPSSWFTTPDTTGVWFAILDENNEPLFITQASATNDPVGTVGGSGRITAPGYDSSHNGKTIVISPGWTRRFPKEFRYLYDTWYFVPDYDSERTYDPPTEEFPGMWVFRPRSTNYKFFTELGFATDTGTPAFEEGDVARYVGDNSHDPTTTDNAKDGLSRDTIYRDKAYTNRVKYDPEVFEGFATAGGGYWLEDSSKLWWEGQLFAHTGSLSSGGAATVADSSKSSNGFWTGPDARNFTGFVLEITSGVLSGTQYPITAHAGTSLTVYNPSGTNIPSGSNYTIREPRYLRNRWRDRKLQVVKKDGTVLNLVITHNTNNRLFFQNMAGGQVVEEGDRFQIKEVQPGSVLKRVGTSWEYPVGADPRGRPWRREHNNNLPHEFLRYGRLRKGDAFTREFFNELYRGINALAHRKNQGLFMHPGGVNYTFRDGPGVHAAATSAAQAHAFGSADFEALAGGTTQQSLTTVAPRTFVRISTNGTGAYSAGFQSSHMDAVLSNAATVRIMHAADAYIYTSTDHNDNGEYSDPTGIDEDNPFFNHDTENPAGIPYERLFASHGYNVFYRKWGLVSSVGPSYNSEDRIRVGDSTQAGTEYGSPDGSTPPGGISDRAWATAANPLIIHRWDVPGGYFYWD